MPAEDYGPVIEVNATTGEVTTRPLTPEEVTARDALSEATQASLAAEQAKQEARDAALSKLSVAADSDTVSVKDLKDLGVI